jgi:hypothetical protein
MPRTEADDLGRILTITSCQILRTTDTAANQVVKTSMETVVERLKSSEEIYVQKKL